MRLIDKFDDAVHFHPGRPFIRDGAVTRSYAESAAQTNRIARAILRDAAPGVRVGIWSNNGFEAIEAIYGIMRAGAVFVPLNARNSVTENVDLLNQYGVGGLFIEEQFLAACPDFARHVPGLRFVVALRGEGKGAVAYERWCETDGSPLESGPFSRDDLWAIYSTSGTTGRPKGVCHSHLNALTSTNDLRTSLGIGKAAKHLVVSPVTHMAGLMLFSLTPVGSTHIVAPSTRPDAILRTLAEEEIDVVFLPPTLIYMVLAIMPEGATLPHLRTVVTAGAPMSPERADDFLRAFGPILVGIYAQAEVFGPLTCLRPEDYLDAATGALIPGRIASVGRPTPPRIIRIMDDAGNLLPAGETGEVVVRSFTVMDGFLDDPAATRESQAFGWHHTGDVGFLDGDGYLTLVDRKRDMIITGGFNVFSVEVENALHTHPAVQEAAVLGVADEKWGEAVTAVVELKPGCGADEEALIAHCKALIGSVKAPKRIVLRAELPRNSNGKVLKKVLRQEARDRLL